MKVPAYRQSWAIAALLLLLTQSGAQGGRLRDIRLGGHVPLEGIRHSHHLGHLHTRANIDLAFSLKPRDPDGLSDLVRRINDPTDPEYHRFITTAQFRDRFGPAPEAVSEVVAYLQSEGFTKVTVHDNNLIVDATAPAETVERAFQLELHEYQTNDGRRVRAPNDDPMLNESVAARLHGIAGLSTFHKWKTHTRKMAVTPLSVNPNSHMTPAKIKSAYGFSTLSTAGAGEIVAIFELDGFHQSDIDAYATQFGITQMPIDILLVDGFNGAAGAAQDEVCLDIELVMAVSPGLSRIKVYEGPNTDNGVLDTYSRIASDNTAMSISTSWGASEDGDTTSFLNSENTIFQQMSSQGQSIFAASGDSGAFDDSDRPTTLQVDDPASQTLVTAVGGTTLTLSGTAYSSETSWGDSVFAEGGGGGVSAVWSIPSYQAKLASTTNKGSFTRRMVPDVSIDADPNTGYSIFTGGAWHVYGGTSAAAPIWAAFIAQVNQARVAASLSRLGFANTALYQIGQSSLYATTFHDIADGSTNLFFPATTGYDLTTGFGSPKGAALLTALSAAALPPYPPSTVSTSGAGGGNVFISWNAATGATGYEVFRSATFNGVFTSIGTTAALSKTDLTAAGGNFYYYVIATNGAGNSGPSAKRAGGDSLTAPAASSGLSGGGAP